jgi:protein TonB
MTMPNSYRVEKHRARADRRNTANSRAKITAARSTIADPLSRPRPNDSDFAFALAAALAIHGALVLFAFLARSPQTHRDAYRAPVQIEISDPPKPPDPPPPVVEPPPTVIPPSAAPPVLKPIAAIDTPPPDPIQLDPPPTIDPPKPVRRVVGIDMESTTVAGPAFATGNTRMGETSQVAQDPTTIDQAPGTFSPPKRLSAPPPEYPPSLRAQKIEGDVGLRVVVDASGHVQEVTVVAPSEHDEFDRAAVAAANASTYESAKANGVAISRAIEFTVRFRLHP